VIAACRSVALAKVVGRGEPFQFTTVSGVKVVPLVAITSSVKPDAPQYGIELTGGELPSTDAVPILKAEIVKFAAADVPPPGAGVNTVTATVPAESRSVAGTGALSWVGFR
jgi:hypothetical protein